MGMMPQTLALQVIGLAQWLKELGIIDKIPNVALGGGLGGTQKLGFEDQYDLLVSGRSFLGLSTSSARQRAKLDRAFLDHLANLATSSSLSLDEVADDLQVWRLKLHDRAARRRLTDIFGTSLLRRRGGQGNATLRAIPPPAEDEAPAARKGHGYDIDFSSGPRGGGKSAAADADLGGNKASQGGYPGGRADAGGSATDLGDENKDLDEDSGAASKSGLGKVGEDDDEKKKRQAGDEEDDEEDARRRADEEGGARAAREGGHGTKDEAGRNKGAAGFGAGLGGALDSQGAPGKHQGDQRPKGLFRVKDYGPRPSTDDSSLQKLFPSMKKLPRRVDGSVAEDDEDEEDDEVEPPRPPATAPAQPSRTAMKGNLAEEFREAVRIAWERAVQEVEAAWELGPKFRGSSKSAASLDLTSKTALRETHGQEGHADQLLESCSPSLATTQRLDVLDLGPSEVIIGLSGSADGIGPTPFQRGGQSGELTDEDDDSFAQQTSAADHQRLHRQRYAKSLQARARDGQTRHRTKKRWMQRVDSCRRSLGSLTALGTFADGAADDLRRTVDGQMGLNASMGSVVSSEKGAQVSTLRPAQFLDM